MLKFARAYLSSYNKACFSTSQQPHQFNVLFFGTDIIAKTVLEALDKNRNHNFKTPVVQNLAVVTSPDVRGKKHQQPVKVYCEEKRINFYQPLSTNKDTHTSEWDAFVNEQLKNNGIDKFDVGIACSFGHMIPDNVIDSFEHGMVVLHPSLLPRYRGASPIQYALLNGDQETGITIIEISKGKFDAGKIFIQEKLPIVPTIRYEELALELAVLGGNRILDYLENMAYYKQKGYSQSESSYKKSSAKKFDVEDTILDWKGKSNIDIYNRYRAMWKTGYTTVRTKFEDQWFFIDEMGLVADNSEEDTLLKSYANAEPGSVWLIKHKKYKNYLYIKCKTGWVVARGGYMESTKPQPAYKFIERYLNKDKAFSDNSVTGHFFFK